MLTALTDGKMLDYIIENQKLIVGSVPQEHRVSCPKNIGCNRALSVQAI